ncbi:MAG TPA: hypothetical protein VJR70_04580 [Stellaceae bacterium]|nr:hypothetical protein [Stellaceae bacterium]
MPADERPAYTARPGEAVRVFRDGDGNFAIGAGRLRVAAPDSDDMAYVAAVVEALGGIAHSPAGEAALRRGDELGQPVLIAKPTPPTAPPNAWVVPDDLAAAARPGVTLATVSGAPAAGTGAGCGSTIFYDPADWPESSDLASPGRADILLLMLEQANANAGGKSHPSRPDWGVRLRS